MWYSKNWLGKNGEDWKMSLIDKIRTESPFVKFLGSDLLNFSNFDLTYVECFHNCRNFHPIFIGN